MSEVPRTSSGHPRPGLRRSVRGARAPRAGHARRGPYHDAPRIAHPVRLHARCCGPPMMTLSPTPLQAPRSASCPLDPRFEIDALQRLGHGASAASTRFAPGAVRSLPRRIHPARPDPIRAISEREHSSSRLRSSGVINHVFVRTFLDVSAAAGRAHAHRPPPPRRADDSPTFFYPSTVERWHTAFECAFQAPLPSAPDRGRPPDARERLAGLVLAPPSSASSPVPATCDPVPRAAASPYWLCGRLSAGPARPLARGASARRLAREHCPPPSTRTAARTVRRRLGRSATRCAWPRPLPRPVRVKAAASAPSLGVNPERRDVGSPTRLGVERPRRFFAARRALRSPRPFFA